MAIIRMKYTLLDEIGPVCNRASSRRSLRTVAGSRDENGQFN